MIAFWMLVAALMALALVAGVLAGVVLALAASSPAFRKLNRKGYFLLERDVVPVRVIPHAPDRVRLLALGDIGTGDENQARVAAVVEQRCLDGRCDFVLLLGDNFYERGVQSLDDEKFERIFGQRYRRAGKPFLAVLGNHDSKQNALAQVLYSLRNPQWLMPNFSYTFAAGPARFFALNTNLAPLHWFRLRKALDAAPAGAAWTLAYGHHPIYGSGMQGDVDAYSRWYWHRHLQRRVDFYLSGHDHELEHLRVPGQSTTDYLVSGAAGSHYREHVKAGAAFKRSHASSLFLHRDNGLVALELDPREARVTFLDAQGQPLYEFTRGRSVPG